MWTRRELKDKAKTAFKANYWKSVFVGLVLMALIGGMSIYSSASSATAFTAPTASTISPNSDGDVSVQFKDGKLVIDVDDRDVGKVHVNVDADDWEKLSGSLDGIDVDDEDITQASLVIGPGMVVAGFAMAMMAIVVLALAIALYVFILSPLEVGAQRFFLRNLNQRAEVKEVAFGYDNNYRENVKTLFLRSLFIFLWSLLFVIPGIYKAYQYRMIPFLLADDPTMTKDRAFAESKRLMDGNKWKTFVLDLSFLGWNILSAMTLGILGVFYVVPYQAQTNAALYEKLAYGLPDLGRGAQTAPATPVAPASAASEQAAAIPVIVSQSVPPIPPFAQVGAGSSSGLDTTVPLPESGIDPTIPMRGNVEDEGQPNSPDA